MGSYTPKVGGNVWRQRLTAIQQRERELELGLEQLRRAASNDRTQIVLLEMMLKVRATLLDVEVLMQLGRETQ